MMKFYGRETELKSIYYECKQTTEQNNVGSLSELVGEAFDFPKPAFADMESLLRFLFRTSEKMGGVLFFMKQNSTKNRSLHR